MRAAVVVAVISAVAMFATAARADWDTGDPHKMHFPQLPDPDGWDVNINGDAMFDDWKCSSTGPVEDIHFWVSNKGDVWNPQQTPGDPCPISRLRNRSSQRRRYSGLPKRSRRPKCTCASRSRL